MRGGPGLTFPVVALGAIALFGNGLKSIVSSSVLVSEAEFARNLGIPVERTGLLLEAIVAGMVIGITLCPVLLQRMSASRLGVVAGAVAAAALAAFGLVEIAQQPPQVREIAAFFCLTTGSGALACLAPVSQALIAAVDAPARRTPLTTLWTAAAPAGFLAAPQLVKYALPLLGIGGYFLAFSVWPLLVLALLGLAALAPRSNAAGAPVLPTTVLVSLVAVIVLFELWSTLGSLRGYLQPATLASLALLTAAAVWLIRSARTAAAATGPVRNSTSAWLLAALFTLQVPTTGFFDTAFLYGHQFAPSFIADRSTFAAAAQVTGTFVAGALLHRMPQHRRLLVGAAVAITLAGVLSISIYPWIASAAYFRWTPSVQGFGTGALTACIVLAVMRDAQDTGKAAHSVLAAMPSLAIIVGTEFGLEMLQLVYAGASAVHPLGNDDAYAFVFGAQWIAALLVPVALAFAWRGGLRTPASPQDA
jgi:hypothetical protein